MNVFSLQTKYTRHNGTRVWFPIETELTLDELHDALLDVGMVRVTRLHGQSRGEHYVYDRTSPILITKETFTEIYPMEKPVMEHENGVERG